MRIYISVQAYNWFGGHLTLECIGGLLELDAPGFGSALEEMDVCLYFRSASPDYAQSPDLHYMQHVALAKLPTCRFLRNKRRIYLKYECTAATSEELDSKERHEVPLLQAAYAQLLVELEAIRKRFKKTDAFDVDGFLAWAHGRSAHLPRDDSEFEQLKVSIKAMRKARDAALDEWQKLDLDWNDFHPTAREVLDDTFYWSGTDVFAPHGNDTGADLFLEFLKWRPRNRVGSSAPFFKRLMSSWDIDSEELDETDTMIEVFDDSCVALAFAHLKFDGVCPAAARELALEAIRRQRRLLEANDSEWPLLSEKLRRLQQLELKLHATGA